MERISSKMTGFYKRVFPLLWIGGLAFIASMSLIGSGASWPERLPSILGPVVMAIFGYVMMRFLIFDLVDEVWDHEDALVIRNSGREESVPLANIINIDSTIMTNPLRVTLTLRESCAFGKKVVFTPPMRMFDFHTHPIVADLIDRIDRARRQN